MDETSGSDQKAVESRDADPQQQSAGVLEGGVKAAEETPAEDGEDAKVGLDHEID